MGQLLWELLPWGYQVLLAIEGLRTGLLDVLFSLITDIGSEFGYLVIVCLVYWCVNKGVGQVASFAYLSAATLNLWLKDIWLIPRPDDPALEGVWQRAGIVGRLMPLRHETSPSFPSTHAQVAATAWGYLAARLGRTWFWAIAVTLIVLISFSRLYLGVHLPQDVLAGVAIGIVYLAAWLAAAPRVQVWLSRRALGWRWALAMLVPLVLWAAHPRKDTTAALGAMMGLGIGYLLEGQTTRFRVEGEWWRRILRAGLGLALVLAVYLALSTLSASLGRGLGWAFEMGLRGLRYGLVGLTAGWVAPWLFVRCQLASRE